MAIEKKINTEAVNDYLPIRFEIRTEISDCRSLLFDPPCRNPAKSVPRGKAIWNANGGFVSVLLTHLLYISLHGLALPINNLVIMCRFQVINYRVLSKLQIVLFTVSNYN